MITKDGELNKYEIEVYSEEVLKDINRSVKALIDDINYETMLRKPELALNSLKSLIIELSMALDYVNKLGREFEKYCRDNNLVDPPKGITIGEAIELLKAGEESEYIKYNGLTQVKQ